MAKDSSEEIREAAMSGDVDALQRFVAADGAVAVWGEADPQVPTALHS